MGWNDPRWGDREEGRIEPHRRPGGEEGPPDLDEVWRTFNERLNALFGKGNGEGGGEGRDQRYRGGRRGWGGMLLLVGIVGVALWLLSGFYKVEANERGVVLRFGRYVETTEPGLRWRLPWPIETHEVVDLTGVRTVEVGYRGSERNKMLRESLMLTDDENIVSIMFAVQYVLRSPEDYLFRDRAPDESVKQVAESAMREIVGKSKMDFVLYEGREEIAARSQALMQQMLDRYQTGVQVVRVTLQNAQPPEQVQAAFDDAVKAGQDRERLRNEGEAYANAVIPRARGAAARLIEEAEGYRARVIAQAEGDIARFLQVYEQYRHAPSVMRDRLYVETMQQVLQRASKVVVDLEGGNPFLLLPMGEWLSRMGATGSGRGGGAETGTPPLGWGEGIPQEGTGAAGGTGAIGGGSSEGSNQGGRSLPRERGSRP